MNLSEIVVNGARYFGDKTALVYQDNGYNYQDLNALIDNIALYLKEFGTIPGDRVALYLPNCPQWIAVYYAIIRIGAVSVCVSYKLKIYEAYGMTETASLVTYNHRYKHKIGSVGMPAGIVEVKIIDRNGTELPGGETGEIAIRGPNVMKGYINKPKESAEILRDGWLHSGDLGYLDEQGYLFIVDRIKDVIISGGLNIYPSEVEDVLYKHSAVEECSVIGMPHPEYGEAVTAYVIKKQDRICAEDDLIRFCKKRIASYKAPKKILFVRELPKSPTGKILKRVIRKSIDNSD